METITYHHTLNDIRRAHKGHWFDSDTIRWFKTTFPDGEYGIWFGRYFITGERMHGDERRYSIRMVTEHGDIETIGAFQQYRTAAQARVALKKINKQRLSDDSAAFYANKGNQS